MGRTRRTFGPREARVLRIAAVALVVCLGVAGSIALYSAWDQGLTAQDIEETIRSWGPWGVAASILLMTLHSFVPFPAEFLAIINGMCYGPFWGTVVTWIGAMFGAFAAFGVARALGRPFVQEFVASREWEALDSWSQREGWQVVFLSRFTPIIAFNLVNYAAGLSAISWKTFAWTTGLGILPLTILMVVLGDQAENLPWTIWLLVFGAGVLVWLGIRLRIRRRRRPPLRS